MKTGGRVRISLYRPAAVLKVTGADALSFLQGQFTQELRSVGQRPVAYGLWLNQKGKVVGDSFVFRGTDELWWLASYFSPAAAIQERLESYIIADDVSVEDVSAAWTGLVIVGEDAENWVRANFGSLPGAGEFGRSEAGIIFRGRRGVGGWEWLVPAGVDALTEGVEVVAAAELERWRIENVVPAVGRDIGLADLPNEAGLDVDAVSYSKGCYLGQEVMARLKSMGQVRRRLVRVRGTGAVPSVLPAALYVGEKKVGELRSVARVEEGFIGLAMVSLLGLDANVSLRVEGDVNASIDLDPKTP